MRRPLCLFCAGALGVELVCAFLPQAWLLPLLAAIFVCGLLAAVLGRKPLKLGGILLLAGAVLGLGAVLRTHARLNALQAAYDGTSVTLTAEVEQVRTSFYPGVVDAVLRVETVDGEAADFRVECAALPRCSAGERVRGTFALEALPEGEQRSAYADGIALNAELAGGTKLERLGESRSFRARTARLQSRLSAALRRGMAEDPAGVLAAMVTGDRTHLSTRLRNAYRRAGLSHVLVVSGMHVSILCGSVLARFRLKHRKLRSYASCRRNALFRAGMAVLLVGVTGFTPSVLRAGAAVWISALGVWVYGPADALTSLGVAGVLMTAGNSYAVCDIGFELSYAAVLGTLAGAALARRSAERREEKRRRNKKTAGKRGGVLANCLRQQGAAVWETLCVSGCACMATFPVLVLRGLSTSLYALVSSVAVLWLVEPILLLGLAAALTGLAPALEPLHRATAFGAEVLVDLLDRWALWVSGWPGAQIYFDTAYAALVCLLLAALLGLAWHWNIRLRAAVPAVLLTAALAIGAGNAFSRDVVRVELVGSKMAPAVILSQNDRAVVFYRGGQTTRKAVETALERRSIRTVEALIDLRMDPQEPCTLRAEQTVRAARLAANTTQTLRTDTALLEVLRTQTGCAVRFTIEGQSFVTLSGTVRFAQPLEVDWLLASGQTGRCALSGPSHPQHRLPLDGRGRRRAGENAAVLPACSGLEEQPLAQRRQGETGGGVQLTQGRSEPQRVHGVALHHVVMGGDGAGRAQPDGQLSGLLGFQIADAVALGAEEVLPVDGGQQQVGAGERLQRFVQMGRQVGVAQVHDRKAAEGKLIPQRHAGVARIQNVFRVGGGKGPDGDPAQRQDGTFLHRCDAVCRDAIFGGEGRAPGRQNEPGGGMPGQPAQGVFCHVVGVAVGAEHEVCPQCLRCKGGRIAAAGAAGAGQVAEYRVDADDGVLVLENEPALADRPDGQLAGGEPGG